jgi:hypothetical protein
MDQQGGEAKEQAVKELKTAARNIRGAHLALALLYFRNGEQQASDQEVRAYAGSESPDRMPLLEKWLAKAAAVPHSMTALGLTPTLKN